MEIYVSAKPGKRHEADRFYMKPSSVKVARGENLYRISLYPDEALHPLDTHVMISPITKEIWGLFRNLKSAQHAYDKKHHRNDLELRAVLDIKKVER